MHKHETLARTTAVQKTQLFPIAAAITAETLARTTSRWSSKHSYF
jgi:hypothetical protein